MKTLLLLSLLSATPARAAVPCETEALRAAEAYHQKLMREYYPEFARRYPNPVGSLMEFDGASRRFPPYLRLLVNVRPEERSVSRDNYWVLISPDCRDVKSVGAHGGGHG